MRSLTSVSLKEIQGGCSAAPYARVLLTGAKNLCEADVLEGRDLAVYIDFIRQEFRLSIQEICKITNLEQKQITDLVKEGGKIRNDQDFRYEHYKFLREQLGGALYKMRISGVDVFEQENVKTQIPKISNCISAN